MASANPEKENEKKVVADGCESCSQDKIGKFLVGFLVAVILGATAYFAKFWYDALNPVEVASEVQGSAKTAETNEKDSAKNSSADKTPATESFEKSSKPKVNLFVMSFCPYGNLAENTIKPVIDLLGEKVDWNVNYIASAGDKVISSLHGQPEVDQDMRELCVKELYDSSKMWDFILYVNKNCGSDGSCWKEGANSMNISADSVEKCVADKGFDLLSADSKIAEKSSAQASPTLLINGTQSSSIYSYGNPNKVKDAVCSAFEKAPEECKTELENTSENVQGSCN